MLVSPSVKTKAHAKRTLQSECLAAKDFRLLSFMQNQDVCEQDASVITTFRRGPAGMTKNFVQRMRVSPWVKTKMHVMKMHKRDIPEIRLKTAKQVSGEKMIRQSEKQ